MPSWSARVETVELHMPCCNAYISRRVEFAENGVVRKIQKIPQKCKECHWVFGEEEQDALKHQLHELVRELGGEEPEDEESADRFVMKHPDRMIPGEVSGEYDG